MRKLMAAALLALPLSIGCTTVGGVCDCAPVPGDSTGYNPHVTYHATCPTGPAPAAVVPVAPVVPNGGVSNVDPFEPVGLPKTMPKN
jgi:hypothetical protein